MNILKSIFRIDYPLSYSIVDKLGWHLERIHERTLKTPFSRTRSNLDLTNHMITTRANIGSDFMGLTLCLNTFNFTVEHVSNLSLSNIHEHPIFNLSQSIIENLFKDGLVKINRIGLRVWTIIDESNITFDLVKNYMCESNRSIISSFNGFKSTDCCFILEAKKNDDTCLRLHFGPYQKSESYRYFEVPREIETGLIVDADVWQSNLKMPELNVVKNIRYFKSTLADVLSNLKHNALNNIK